MMAIGPTNQKAGKLKGLPAFTPPILKKMYHLGANNLICVKYCDPQECSRY